MKKTRTKKIEKRTVSRKAIDDLQWAVGRWVDMRNEQVKELLKNRLKEVTIDSLEDAVNELKDVGAVNVFFDDLVFELSDFIDVDERA